MIFPNWLLVAFAVWALLFVLVTLTAEPIMRHAGLQ
jgi:uncharacterized protein YodC (DUF2158 family)